MKIRRIRSFVGHRWWVLVLVLALVHVVLAGDEREGEDEDDGVDVDADAFGDTDGGDGPKMVCQNWAWAGWSLVRGWIAGRRRYFPRCRDREEGEYDNSEGGRCCSASCRE